ncbi:MAG: RNA polymerase sigma factor [Hyphomonadaceae bacterium]
MGLSDSRFRIELRSLIPRLRRFGHALTGSTDDGDDLVQDALEKALSRESQFQHGTRMDSWIYKIMQNAWIDRKRSAASRGTVVQPLEDNDFAVGEDGRESFAAKITLRQVREMMQRLHVDERAVLALVAIEGQSYLEAAEILRIPIGTVMSRLARARNKLTSLLDGGATPSNHD